MPGGGKIADRLGAYECIEWRNRACPASSVSVVLLLAVILGEFSRSVNILSCGEEEREPVDFGIGARFALLPLICSVRTFVDRIDASGNRQSQVAPTAKHK